VVIYRQFTSGVAVTLRRHARTSPRLDGGFDHGIASLGRRTVNTEPLPGSLVTVTSPPIMRASLRVMARPSPVPPKRCAVEASAWLNSSNSFACLFGSQCRRHCCANYPVRRITQ
jgi:hypothetical protein